MIKWNVQFCLKYVKVTRKIFSSICFGTKRYRHDHAVNMSYNTLHHASKTTYPPLVMLHGLLGNKNNFRFVGKAIGKQLDIEVVSCDLRNHGESPHTDEMDYNLMSDDVVQLLDNIGHDDCILLGHSMGGRVAMHTALTWPERVRDLIIVDVSPVGSSLRKNISSGGASAMRYIEYMRNINIDGQKSLAAARSCANKQLVNLVPERSVREFVISNLTQNVTGEFVWKVNIDSVWNNFKNLTSLTEMSQYTPFSKRSIFIGGQHSPYIRDEDLPAIKQLFPASTVVHIDDCGHWVHAEKPQQFIQIVHDHILQ